MECNISQLFFLQAHHWELGPWGTYCEKCCQCTHFSLRDRNLFCASFLNKAKLDVIGTCGYICLWRQHNHKFGSVCRELAAAAAAEVQAPTGSFPAFPSGPAPPSTALSPHLVSQPVTASYSPSSDPTESCHLLSGTGASPTILPGPLTSKSVGGADERSRPYRCFFTISRASAPWVPTEYLGGQNCYDFLFFR